MFTRWLRYLPKILGKLPKILGRFNKVLGELPKFLGRFNNCLSELPYLVELTTASSDPSCFLMDSACNWALSSSFASLF